MSKASIKYYIALAAAVSLWSSAFVVSKVALAEWGPLTLALARILLSFLLLLPMALKRGFAFKQLFTRRSFICGIFGYGGNMALVTTGLVSCSAGMSAIIHGLFPLFMVFFGRLLLSEHMNIYKIISVTLSVIGVLTASLGDFNKDSGSTVTGMVLVAVSVLIWAFYSVYAKKNCGDLDATVLTEICFGTSFICLLPFTLMEISVTGFTPPAMPTVLSLVFLCLFSGVIGSVLWNIGVRKTAPAVSGVYFNLMPVLGLAIAVAAGESTDFGQIAGCILILSGVYIGTKADYL